MDNPGGRVPNFTRSGFLLHIVLASTSDQTEYVVDALIDSLKDIAPGWEIEETMAETTQPHVFGYRESLAHKGRPRELSAGCFE
jgi:hypothetical protein